MSTAYFYHPDCAKHDMGACHPESPQRIGAIHQALEISGLLANLDHQRPKEATREHLVRVHDADYVDDIFQRSPKSGVEVLDADTSINPYSLRAALLAAGAVIQATEKVCEGEATNAFCNVRPPGHHAEHDKAMGFCIFNNIAVGIVHALEKYKLSRVALLDFDVHHGNGSEDIFQNDDRVMLCQTFQSPLYPGTGEKFVENHIINAPLKAGSEGENFRAVVKQEWLPELENFKPQMIFISAGFDAHKDDPLAQLALNEMDYAWVTEKALSVAERYAGARVVSSLEGGYNLQALGASVQKHISVLANRN